MELKISPPPQMYTSNNTISFNKPILDPEWAYVMFNVAILRNFWLEGIFDQIPKALEICIFIFKNIFFLQIVNFFSKPIGKVRGGGSLLIQQAHFPKRCCGNWAAEIFSSLVRGNIFKKLDSKTHSRKLGKYANIFYLN